MEANTDTSTSRNICALRVTECVHLGAELHTNICGSMKVFTEMVKPYREEHKDTQAYVFFHTHPPLHPWGSSSHRQECLPTHKYSLKTKCQQVHSGTCKTHAGASGHKYTQVCQPTLRSADMEWHTHTRAHTHPCRPVSGTPCHKQRHLPATPADIYMSLYMSTDKHSGLMLPLFRVLPESGS